MPKLPKGMFRRGPSFYVRLWQDGQDKWVCLGEDFQEAKETLKATRRGETPVRGGSHGQGSGGTVAQALCADRSG
jgi:hypothetical protein